MALEGLGESERDLPLCGETEEWASREETQLTIRDWNQVLLNKNFGIPFGYLDSQLRNVILI
jgi:hypothetical protein